MLDKLHPVDQLRTVLDNCKGILGEAVDGFCRLFKVRLCGTIIHVMIIYQIVNIIGEVLI